VRIMTVLEIRIRQEIRRNALVQWEPRLCAVLAFGDTSYRDAEIEVARIGRIDADRVHLCAVRTGHDGGFDLRIQAVVEAGDSLPCDAVIVRADQTGRGCSRIPG